MRFSWYDLSLSKSIILAPFCEISVQMTTGWSGGNIINYGTTDSSIITAGNANSKITILQITFWPNEFWVQNCWQTKKANLRWKWAVSASDGMGPGCNYLYNNCCIDFKYKYTKCNAYMLFKKIWYIYCTYYT